MQCISNSPIFFFPIFELKKKNKKKGYGLLQLCESACTGEERRGEKKERRKEREANDVDLKRGARLLDGAGREDATPRAATLTHRVYLARGPPRPIVV